MKNNYLLKLVIVTLSALGFVSCASTTPDASTTDTQPDPSLASLECYPADEVDKRPEALSKEYPYTIGLGSGSAHVLVIVELDGTVAYTKLLKSSNSDYGHLACVAAKKWRFKPAEKGGKNVRCAMVIPFVYYTRIRTQIQ